MIQSNRRPQYYPVDLFRGWVDAGETVVADRAGLRLAATAQSSPLGFAAIDGSLGRVTLPQGVAVDGRLHVYFAERATGDIWHFDPEAIRPNERPFERVFRFETPVESVRDQRWSLAATSTSLLIVRPGCRELIAVALGYWAVQERHCFPGQEQVLDVATRGDTVYVLTDQSVYERTQPSHDWRRIDTNKPTCTRLVVARSGDVFACSTSTWRRVVNRSGSTAIEGSASQLDRTEFARPWIVTHPQEQLNALFQYVIPPLLANRCPGEPLPEIDASVRSQSVASKVASSPDPVLDPTTFPPELAGPKITAPMLATEDLAQGFLIREDGQRIRTAEFRPANQRLFSKGGADHPSVWFSPPIDSHVYRCVWDRLELWLDVPSGCRVIVSTATRETNPHRQDNPSSWPEAEWSLGAIFESPNAGQPNQQVAPVEFLVRDQPGQRLYLRVMLSGDGFATPVVRRMLAKGPRQSHVDFLPAVMREDAITRDFLERFVSIFQTEWDRLEETVDHIQRLFRAESVPDSQLANFAQRFGIALPNGWPIAKCRQLLKLTPQLLMAPEDESRGLSGGCRRGTVEHIRHAVRAVLAGTSGLDASEMRGFPWIIEGFRERNQFQLGTVSGAGWYLAGDQLAPPTAPTLWGPDSTGRLLLGDNSVLGERKLLPPAESHLDRFRAHAHRIRVVIPACWLKNDDDLQAVEAMLDAEKPAHVAYEIQLVRAGMRVGLQSTIGVDTILGDWPPPVLGQPTEPRLGLGQGVTLPPAPDTRPPPVTTDGLLTLHSL